jgi:DNA-binding Lrp family transcriptional regulator
MMFGYVKLYHKLLDSRVFQNEGLLKVWIWCLLRASYKERWVSLKVGKGQTEIHLLPGQFIFGRKTAAKDLKMNPSTVWKRIKKLENMQNCDIQSNNQYSVVTIVNWGFYQGDGKKVTAKVTAREQPSDTNKKVKKVKKVKNSYSLNSHEFRLSELLLNLILERRDSFKRPDLQKWARHIDLMIRVDGRPPEEIERVI